MLHKEIGGLTLLAFILWIFIGTASQRIERVCSPVGWFGNVTVSLAALAIPTYQAPTQKWFDKFTYGCQYTVWRLFYQDEYNKYTKGVAGEKGSEPAGEVSPSTAKSASGDPEPLPTKEAQTK